MLKIRLRSSQHCMRGGGEVKQERLYSRLTCVQRRQKSKFVSRLLSMNADSRPSKLLSLWLVLSPPSASSSIGQVLHLVWCSLGALMTLKSPKKVKNYSRKSRWFKNHAKVNATSFSRTEKYRFTNHGKNKPSFTFHAKQKLPFTRHEKSIGDLLNVINSFSIL